MHTWSIKIEVYKIVNGLEGIEIGSMFIKRVDICRGYSQKLFKKRYVANIYCFTNRVCDEWNRLPGKIVNAGSVHSFKGRLDHYYRCIIRFK